MPLGEPNLWNVSSIRPPPFEGQRLDSVYLVQPDRSLPNLRAGFRTWEKDRWTYPDPSFFYTVDAVRADQMDVVTPDQYSFFNATVSDGVPFQPNIDLPSSRVKAFTEDGVPTENPPPDDNYYASFGRDMMYWVNYEQAKRQKISGVANLPIPPPAPAGGAPPPAAPPAGGAAPPAGGAAPPAGGAAPPGDIDGKEEKDSKDDDEDEKRKEESDYDKSIKRTMLEFGQYILDTVKPNAVAPLPNSSSSALADLGSAVDNNDSASMSIPIPPSMFSALSNSLVEGTKSFLTKNIRSIMGALLFERKFEDEWEEKIVENRFRSDVSLDDFVEEHWGEKNGYVEKDPIRAILNAVSWKLYRAEYFNDEKKLDIDLFPIVFESMKNKPIVTSENYESWQHFLGELTEKLGWEKLKRPNDLKVFNHRLPIWWTFAKWSLDARSGMSSDPDSIKAMVDEITKDIARGARLHRNLYRYTRPEIDLLLAASIAINDGKVIPTSDPGYLFLKALYVGMVDQEKFPLTMRENGFLNRGV